MSISGRELMRLLERDGWIRGGRRTHGVFYSKQFPGESRPRSTVVPDQGNVATAIHTGCYPQRETDRDWRQRVASSDAADIGKSHHVRAERGLPPSPS